MRSSKNEERVLEYENGAYVKQNAFCPRFIDYAKRRKNGSQMQKRRNVEIQRKLSVLNSKSPD